MSAKEMAEALGPHINGYAMKVKAEREGAVKPYRTHDGDAGFDLSYAGKAEITVSPGEYADVPCGFSVEFPPGMWSLLIGRSSTFRQRGIMVNPAIIDAGFRGELFAVCRNIGLREVTILPGERLAQVIPLPLLAHAMPVVEAEELSPSDRGTNGFGSTGL